jgi:DNA repair exonuclease SbcCD ATPase subunit
MDTEKLITEFKGLLDEQMKAKDFSEDAVASITKVFHDAIKDKNESYLEEVEKAEAEKQEAEKAQEALITQVSDLEEKLQSTEEKLQSLEEEAQQREATARFNARMEEVDSAYELADEDRKVIATELQGLDETDESFAAYQEKLAVVWKHKSKEFIEQLAKEMEEKIQSEVEKRLSTASTQESSTEEQTETTTEEQTEEVNTDIVEEVLDSVEANSEQIANNNTESVETEDSLRDRFSKAFKDSVTIKF